MTTFRFKGCPRCGGDLYLDEDEYGKFLSCLQCGFLRDVAINPVDPALPLVINMRLPGERGRTPGIANKRKEE